jgi:hypothetical protein
MWLEQVPVAVADMMLQVTCSRQSKKLHQHHPLDAAVYRPLMPPAAAAAAAVFAHHLLDRKRS